MPDMQTVDQLAEDVGAGALKRLIGIFERDAVARLTTLRARLDQGPVAELNADGVNELRATAHSLKGLCLTYGANETAAAARALQDACDSGDVQNIEAHARGCVDHGFEEVREILDYINALDAGGN